MSKSENKQEEPGKQVKKSKILTREDILKHCRVSTEDTLLKNSADSTLLERTTKLAPMLNSATKWLEESRKLTQIIEGSALQYVQQQRKMLDVFNGIDRQLVEINRPIIALSEQIARRNSQLEKTVSAAAIFIRPPALTAFDTHAFELAGQQARLMTALQTVNAPILEMNRLNTELLNVTNRFQFPGIRSDFAEFSLFHKAELDRQLEFARRVKEAEEELAKSPFGRFTAFLGEVVDLASTVHEKLKQAEALSEQTSEFFDCWLRQLRHWHCEISDTLDILYHETPVAYFKHVSRRYTRYWYQLTIMQDKLIEIDRMVSAILRKHR